MSQPLKTLADHPQKTSIAQQAPNPCVRNCCLDGEDICLGCFRHVDEITAWHSMSPQARKQVQQQAELRRASRR